MDTKRMRACAPLLPEPGDRVVVECLDEIERLLTLQLALEVALRAMVDRWEPDCEGADRRMWENACNALAALQPNASFTGKTAQREP